MSGQSELLGLGLKRAYPFRLRANDIIRIGGRLALVIRVTECSAVVLLNRPVREFITRFDKRVRIRPSPITFRISPNAEAEILNRKVRRKGTQPKGKEVA